MKVTFICSGNTCRSPMAKVLFRKLLEQRNINNIEVDSAGLACYAGDEASSYAVSVMREHGLNLSDHRSKPCSPYDSDDGIFVCMTKSHRFALQPYVSAQQLKVLGNGIPDPYGGELDEYRACAKQIEEALPPLLKEIIRENTGIVPMRAEQTEQIAEMEKICFSTPWSQQSLEEELTNPSAHFLVAEFEKQVVGYIGVLDICGEADITNVAVLPAYRRCTIADKLLTQAVKEARERKDEFITLEVRESNQGAIALYTKHGFESVGLRKNFYTKPTESAVLMTKRFTAHGKDIQNEDTCH
ncbi:MAG TPA: ribosomal-protein-alanine N-acetyltransferase [Ruminococcaceae bacterium]|nr:ribosomal-protein-alanine N-acetyltransferase [Oscillospiraceae bacterium]